MTTNVYQNTLADLQQKLSSPALDSWSRLTVLHFLVLTWCLALVEAEAAASGLSSWRWSAQGKCRLRGSKCRMRFPSCYCWLFLLDWGWNIPPVCSWRQTKQRLFLSYVSRGWSSCLHACLHKTDVGCGDGLHAAERLALVHLLRPDGSLLPASPRHPPRAQKQGNWPRGDSTVAIPRAKRTLFSLHLPHPCISAPTNVSPAPPCSQRALVLFFFLIRSLWKYRSSPVH